MKNSQETENSCEHCSRKFLRESTLLKHLCEQKRRWLDRDKPSNRIAYSAWLNFYSRYHPGKKNTTYGDFLKSNYYTAFLKFGSYCTAVGALNPGVFGDWLIKNSIPIDLWASDSTYTKYLVEYLQGEEPYEAIRRSISNMLDVATAENIQIGDVFQYVNANRLCYMVTTGKISPWLLYNSASGVQFLDKLSKDQANLVFDYINPERWSIKFKREGATTAEIKKILKEIQL